MLKGIIFDMDGVIIDSSEIHYENWHSVFKNKFNIILRREDFGLQFGRSGQHFTEYFIRKYRLNTNAEKLKEDLFSNHEKLKHKITLKPALTETLNRLKKKYKLALATGASKSAAMDVIARFNLSVYFDFVIGGDQVLEAKPHPEIFLNAAKALMLEPKQCVVVEDATLGIQAAKAANMYVISIEDAFTKYQDHSQADARIKSISEIDDYLLKKLGG